MRALQIEGPGIVREIEAPIPEIKADEALIRVAYSGICATDFEILGGDMHLIREGLIRYPVRFGHEWSGVIEKIGPAVKCLAPGDRVVSDAAVTCGHCPAYLEKRYADCGDIRSLGTVHCWDGSFAQYIVIPERHLYKLPEEISLMQGALIEPSCIALEGLRKLPELAGKTVLINGTGAIGMAAVALARSFKPEKVLLAGRTEEKLNIGRQLGADKTINVKRENLLDVVLAETGGRGADGVVETSGNISAVCDCVRAASYGGGVSFVGFYDVAADGFPIDSVVSRELRISGVMGHFGNAAAVIEVLRRGVDLSGVITHVTSMDEVPSVMLNPGALAGARIKIMADMSKNN